MSYCDSAGTLRTKYMHGSVNAILNKKIEAIDEIEEAWLDRSEFGEHLSQLRVLHGDSRE